MKKDQKKALSVLVRIATWLLVIFTVIVMIFTVVTVSTVDRNDRSIFGLRFYIVQTDSMSRSEKNKDLDVHFNAGDIVIIKKAQDPRALKEGDIIAFMSTNSVSYGETVTHRIREVKMTEEGELLGYVTYGTNTDTDDEALVEPEYVLGVYSGKISGAGMIFSFVKSTRGYLLCVLLPFLLLIAYNGTHVVRLFRKYKREQMLMIEKKREELEAERKRNEDALRELRELTQRLQAEAAEKAAKNAASTDIPSEEGMEGLPENAEDDAKSNNAEDDAKTEKIERDSADKDG